MRRPQQPFWPFVVLALAVALPGPVRAQTSETLEPYKMLRSLQFVQDSVVLGDHSAAEMQRFLLESIDERLRAADSATFEDPRNIDAALIYAMSGGNPATLEFLVSRDVDGNFDNRVSDALRKYLSGKGTLIAKSLGDMVPEYRDKKIGAYLALVAGNITVTRDPAAALQFYDQARLASPGTIIEEAALRRSLSVSIDTGKLKEALGYANRYSRRFLHSPYASQFADLFVQLCVDNYENLTEDDILFTLAFMDKDRQQEVYLRMARKAAIMGKNALATLAADRARALAGLDNQNAKALASLYGGLADIPSNEVDAAMTAIAGIPDALLSPRDQVLRAAAQAVAEEVLRVPVAESPVQDTPVTIDPTAAASITPGPQDQQSVTAPAGPLTDTGNANTNVGRSADPEIRSFVDSGRSKLDEIDNLLSKEGTSK
ncbi:MAG: chemotaxis protein MotC [Allorhizobium sp.]